MKNLILLFVLCYSYLAQAETIKTIQPQPKKATVYLSGAEISYLESIYLVAGTNQIILEGVSPYVDEQSISAYFKGALIIDSRKSLRYPEQAKTNKIEQNYQIMIDKITDSLEDLSYLIKDCNNKISGYQRERQLLLNNRLIKGEFAKDSLGLLKSSLDLLRNRLTNIDEEELNIEKRLNKLEKRKNILQTRYNHFVNLQSNHQWVDPNLSTPIHQIIVTIEATIPITGNLSVKYYIANAGWMPLYDIQSTSGSSKIQLIYRAQVYQNSGLNWKDISLVLSTSNPSVGNTKPVLNEWNLVFGYPNSYTDNLYKKTKTPNALNYNTLPSKSLKEQNIRMQEDDSRGVEMNGNNNSEIEQLFTVNGNLLRTEYEIKTKYNIQSDNKSHHVIINNIEVPVNLAYLAVPKLDSDAFLMGKISNWEDLNLIPAMARIYFDESYIGTTSVYPESLKDTLYVNLGRDKSIVIKRQNVKEKCKETILGEFKVVTKTIEITIRNTKGIALDFEIDDQIPVSKDPAIKVTLIDNDKAVYNEVTGKLTWAMNIKPKDIKKLRFSFEVKYPKDKVVAGL